MSAQLPIKASKTGFTLIELMIALTILAVVSAIGLVSYSQTQKIARDAKRKQDLRSIAFALEIYYKKNGRYPCGSTSGWLMSNSANWLSDVVASGCPGTVNTNIAPDYINKVPVDPKSNDSNFTGSNLGYGYRSDSTSFGNCSTGQWYILMTKLENSSDPETLGSKTLTLCGSATISNRWGYPSSAFILMAP